MRPKPMVEIGGRPLLWHILKTYAHHGVDDFIVCLGYRGYMIKEYFANYFLHSADVNVDMRTGELIFHDSRAEPWRVTLVDTGDKTMTGGRIRRVAGYLDGDPFCLTYGDGLASIDITAQVAFHGEHGRSATMTVVRPPARFGSSVLEGDHVVAFEEKPQAEGGYINGGFFICQPEVLELIRDDATVWEREPLETLAARGELAAWRHDGFWQPMDTLREKRVLEDLWSSGKAPWRVWA